MYPRQSRSIGRYRMNTSLPATFRRDKIRTILINKYVKKYQVQKNPEIKQQITNEIDELLKSKNLNQTHLLSIEMKFKKLYRPNKLRNCNTASITPKVITQPESQISEMVFPPIKSINPPKDRWIQIMEYDIKKFATEEQNRSMYIKKQKLKVKEDLLKQISDRKLQLQMEKNKEHQLDEVLMKNINNEAEEEKRIVMRKVEKIKKERDLRDKQLKDELEKKRKVHFEEKLNEQKRLAELQKQINEEDIEAKKKRNQKLQEAVKLIQENEKYKVIQDSMKLKEREDDKRMLEEQIKSMEKQEMKRVEEMKAKEARIQALVKYSEEHVVKNEMEKKQREEQRFIKEILEKEKMDELKEKKQKEAHREMEVKALKCLDAQIQEKRNRRNEELVRSRALAESLKMETELYNKQQKEKIGRAHV